MGHLAHHDHLDPRRCRHGDAAGHFPRARAIVRVMPNLPVAVRRGVLPLLARTRRRAPVRTAAMVLDARLRALVRERGGVRRDRLRRRLRLPPMSPASSPLSPPPVRAGVSTPALALTAAREAVLGSAWLAASNGESMDRPRPPRDQPQRHHRSRPQGTRRRIARPHRPHACRRHRAVRRTCGRDARLLSASQLI